MKYNSLDPLLLKELPDDDFPALEKRYRNYVLQYDIALKKGTSATMLNSGKMNNSGKKGIILSMIPFLLGMVYVYFQFSGFSITAYDYFISFKTKYPQLIQPLGVVAAILTVTAIVYFFWKIFSPYGKSKQTNNYADIELENGQAFFTQRLYTESNSYWSGINVILIMIFIIGLFLSIVLFIYGMLMIAFVIVIIFIRYWYQKKTNPSFEITRSGEVRIFYFGGKTNEFTLRDCKQITMLYSDAAYESGGRYAGLTKALSRQIGLSTLLPDKIIFTGNNNVNVPLKMKNISTSSKIYINSWGAEFYIATLLKENGFYFTCEQTYDEMIPNNIEGWVATRMK